MCGVVQTLGDTSRGVEMRPVLRHRSALAVLCGGPNHGGSVRGAATPRHTAQLLHSLSNPDHGELSCNTW